ncbi:hypothetical protein APHAL10511_007526 [Amanita phalloides]|nr:hypothetical protein APHAL10511_007526 [Amanita phalloides]
MGAAIVHLKDSYFQPFENATSFLLMRWFYNGNMKTLDDLDCLVREVLLKPDFSLKDLAMFHAARESQHVDEIKDSALVDSLFHAANGWYKVAINVPVPFECVKHTSMSDVPLFKIESLFYWWPIEVVKAALQDASPEDFNLQPFKMYRKCNGNNSEQLEQIYTDIYNSNEFLNKHECVQVENAASEHESVVAAVMLWSDSTQLANFGTASLWPVYLFLGNQSKYVRCKPQAFAAHHIAYIPKLSDKIQDFCREKFGKPATSHILTHLCRELMHEVWKIILDDEFIDGYTHGFLMEFTDGTVHQVFPRIFTYSADYPEKVLLAGIKQLGKCPCPTCLILKKNIRFLGLARDTHTHMKKPHIDDQIYWDKIKTARNYIYKSGGFLNRQQLELLLGPESIVPIQNAFSHRLLKLSFNFFSIFVPDLLHEFELGVWKAIFKHLIRILYAQGNDSIQKLNDQYDIHLCINTSHRLSTDIVPYLLLDVVQYAVFMEMHT